MENKTPIQEWIETKANDYAISSCNGQFPIEYNREQVIRHVFLDYSQGCKELLTYLGLQDIPDPKLEIEALRQTQKDYATKSADLIMARAENERLKECFDNVKKQLLITLEHFNEPKNEYQRGVKYEALRTLNGINALKGETT